MGRDLLHIARLRWKHVPETGGRWQLCKGSREVDTLPGARRDGGQDPLPPAAYLRYCDAAFLCQLFFGFFTGVGVTEVGVKILIQDFCGLFTEVTPFPSETRKENHSYSSRCKQASGRVSWGGSNPCFTHSCCSTQQHDSTISVPLIPSGQPSTEAGLCPDTMQREQCAAMPAFLHPALQGSGLCFWLRAVHLHLGFHPVGAQATFVCCGRNRDEAKGKAGR